MILNSEIMLNYCPTPSYARDNNIDSLTCVIWLNFYNFQRSTDKSKFTNCYKIKEYDQGLCINTIGLTNQASKLLLDSDYNKIRDVIIDFVNSFGELIENKNHIYAQKVETDLQLLADHGLNIDNKYLFGNVNANETIFCHSLRIRLDKK